MTDAIRTMRAMCASSSDPASLTSENVPVPDPGPGELLVQVRGTAITAGELTWPESWPAIPGHDLSGVVAATGAGPAAGDPATRSTAWSVSTAPARRPSSSPSPPPILLPSPLPWITSRRPPFRSAR